MSSYSETEGAQDCGNIRQFLAHQKEIRKFLKRNSAKLVQRRTRHVSVAELARCVGLTRPYLSVARSDRLTLSPETYLRIAEVELDS